MRTVLVTGFGPFDGEASNPSGQLAEGLDGRVIEGRTVRGRVLSVTFGRALGELRRALKAEEPELVLCLGQAGGRTAISVERVAINVDDASIADNAGKRPIDRPVEKGGPVGYWSTLPIKAIVERLRAAGLPAGVSQTAGTFVCNHVFYGLMHTLASQPEVRGGFIHVPYTPEQAARLPGSPPSLALSDQLRAIELSIAVSLTTRRGPRAAGGATH